MLVTHSEGPRRSGAEDCPAHEGRPPAPGRGRQEGSKTAPGHGQARRFRTESNWARFERESSQCNRQPPSAKRVYPKPVAYSMSRREVGRPTLDIGICGRVQLEYVSITLECRDYTSLPNISPPRVAYKNSHPCVHACYVYIRGITRLTLMSVIALL